MIEAEGTSEVEEPAPDQLTEQPAILPTRRALVLTESNRNARTAEPYLEALEVGGMILVRREYDRRDRIGEMINGTRHEVECVVVAGGDNILAAGAIALRDSNLPLGIIPIGRRNNLAAALGILDDPDGAAAVILAGHTRTIDIGSVNGQPFFNAATVGMTLQGTRGLGRAGSGLFGGIRFGLSALRLALGHSMFSAVVRHGTTIHRVRTMQIIVSTERHGGDRRQEGLLDVRIVEPDTRWHLMVMNDAFLPRVGKAQGLRLARGSVIEIVTREPRSITADGEIITITPARFGILPAAMTVYAPPLITPDA